MTTKPYPGATGTFVDKYVQKTWSVRKVSHPVHGILYMRWCIDGEDPGASFSEEDGVYYPNTPEK